MPNVKDNQEEIRSIFEEACAKRELLILLTKYLKFESTFVHLDGNEVHARTVTGGEDALNILDISNMKLRFPYRLDFLEAETHFLGIGTHGGVKTIRFALPPAIFANDGRKSPRITNLNEAYATFSLRGRRMVKASMTDLSTTGARLTLSEDLPLSELRVSDRLMLSIYLSNDISINNAAIIRHMSYRVFGVQFNPALSDSDLTSISDWVFRRQEKERELMAVRSDLSARAARAAYEQSKFVRGGGILIVTRDEELERSLHELLGNIAGNRDFIRVLPAVASLKEVLVNKPHLVILHLTDGHMVERLLLKSLTENIPWEIPTLLLGTNIESETLFEISQTCKVVSSVLYAPNKALFLQRLVLGILRKYYSHGESPTVPL